MQKLKMVKNIKNRESRIVRDLNHKVSRKIVNFAKEKGGRGMKQSSLPIITVKCVLCGTSKKVVVTSEMPFCECGGPMIAIKADLNIHTK